MGSLLVFWPHFVFGQNHLCVTMLHRDSTIQNASESEDFQFLVSCPDDHLSLFHPSGRRAIPSGLQTNQASSVRTTCLSVRTLHCVEKVLSSLHPSGRFSSTPRRLSVLDQFQISFQVPRKGRSINRPDDVVSRSDVRLLKARIVIQILPSRRLTAVVRTRVHQRRKLPIRLQPSGRLPIMVWTRALQIWKLRVEE
jgi:hypothetical protein